MSGKNGRCAARLPRLRVMEFWTPFPDLHGVHWTEADTMSQITQTLASVASQAVTLERTPQPAECRCAAFQRQFTYAARNPFLSWNPGPQTIMNFLVSGAFLDGRFSGLLSADGFISGTGYLLPDDSLMAMRVDSNS